MKCLIFILVLLAGFINAPPVIAEDLTVSRAVLEDKTGTLSIDDVTEREFLPTGSKLSKGFTTSVHWLRLQVRAPTKGSEVVLFIRQPFLNEIRLYESVASDPPSWKSRVTGNYYPYEERDRNQQTLSFVVNVTAPETTFYLRLKTRGASLLSVEALTPEEAERSDHQLDLLAVFFVTAMLFLLLWAINSYWLDRQLVVALFAIHQAVYTLYGLAITGYLAPWLPSGFPQLADLSTTVLYCAVNFTTLLFCRELFKPYQPAPLMLRGLNLFLLAFPLQLAAMLLGYTPFAVILNALLLRFTWWYFVIMTFTLRKEQLPSRRMLQIFFVAITLFFTIFWFVSSTSTNMDNKLLGRQVLVVNGILIGGIFAMILNSRSRRLLLEAQQSALESEAKSEFLALVSHEIRTPLNALVGFSALARKTTDPAQKDEYHAILEQSSRSLMELVNGILDMSKIEAGRMEFETVPFNLRQLLDNLEEQYQPLANQKTLKFQLSITDNVPVWVLGDSIRLRQILANLLSNAIKFTNNGEVSCRVSVPGQTDDGGPSLVRFEVKDTGIGIPDDKRDLLFQPFQQLDPTISRKFGGTGLGLAIARNLLAMMEGSLTLTSCEQVGSCFVVELPLPETEALPETQNTVTALPAIGTVLVVEDNEFNRRLLGDILTSWSQQVVLAMDGHQALQFMEQQHFDLVLLDIRMPGIDGIEVSQRIRQREIEGAQTPVTIIAITADIDITTRKLCLAAGINAVLAKPVIPDQLARTIAEHCEGTMAVPPTAELQLNTRTCHDLRNNAERSRQYRKLLMADINEELKCLQAAMEREARDELGQAAHTLKGLCGHLADQEPAELAGWLQLNAPSAPNERLRLVIEQLQSRLSQENNS
ncbi:Signal transduction histidine kinase [Desulfuromusa kysingii]|uniref:histidine kinase n=1 Tax=Desulfuromusa kysingii TaxID=37625 RepID=A0A1H4AG88_9BACT|nr:hybrid sensor histidine kinase/response regulator [Desulfuromusa kysingii]SEA34960.1 Signal transduction histidine kinase [Desulfuromusa kysingii]